MHDPRSLSRQYPGEQKSNDDSNLMNQIGRKNLWNGIICNETVFIYFFGFNIYVLYLRFNALYFH